MPSGVVRSCPVAPNPFRDSCESVTVCRVKGAFGCFAPTIGEPPGHGPFTRVLRVAAGEPALGRDPGDDLLHAGKAPGGGAGSGACGGVVFGLESRVLAAGDDQVVSDGGGMNAHEVSDAFPAQSEPVHQHPFRVRSAPQPPVHNGPHPATALPGRAGAQARGPPDGRGPGRPAEGPRFPEPGWNDKPMGHFDRRYCQVVGGVVVLLLLLLLLLF